MLRTGARTTLLLLSILAYLRLQFGYQIHHGNSMGLGVNATLLDKNNNKNQDNHAGKFAYAYIVSGCTNVSCTGYILNCLVTAQVLKTHNVTTDVVLLVRMHASQLHTHLAQHLSEWLAKAGIKVAYLPPVSKDSFGTATLEKFRVLELTEYDRVLFMDGDVIPLCNMEYLFQASYQPNGYLLDYVAASGSVAPTTAAIFLVTPQPGLFQQILTMVGNTTSKGEFDFELGWGHVMDLHDTWESWWWKRRIWDFKASASDQGLLLMLFKYTLMNYSQIHPGRVETWQQVDPTYNKAQVVSAPHENYLAKVQTRAMNLTMGCGGAGLRRGKSFQFYFFADFAHFAGGSKPWKQPITHSMTSIALHDVTTEAQFWLHFLGMANQTQQLRLPSMLTNPIREGNPLGGGDRSKKLGIAGGDLFFDPEVTLPVPGNWTWEI